MPKSTKISNYPPQYIQVLEEAINGKELRIELNDKAEAEKLRFNLYGLRTALAAEKHPLARLATTTQLIVKGNILIVQPHSKRPELTSIQEALDTAQDLPSNGLAAKIIEQSLKDSKPENEPEDDGFYNVLKDLGYTSE